MSSPIDFTEAENRMLQWTFTEVFQNAQKRQYYIEVLPSLINKLETWPTSITLTGQESRAIQVLLEEFEEIVVPWPILNRQLTFGRPTAQMEMIQSILAKIQAAS